jgi:hypothetical protein
MSITQVNPAVKFVEVNQIGQFGMGTMPGELYDDDYIATFESNTVQPAMIHTLLKMGKGWREARKDYIHQLQNCAPEDQKACTILIKLIRDSAYIADLWDIIDDRPEGTHWVDLYRDNIKRLESIVKVYTEDPEYAQVNFEFDVAENAQAVINELLLQQTQPISGARVDLDVDGYTGIQDAPEERTYVRVTDSVTAKNADGEEVTVVLTDLQDNPGDNNYYQDLTDYEHLWYEEGVVPSAAIAQMTEREIKVTEEFYALKSKFFSYFEWVDAFVTEDPLWNNASPEHREFLEKLGQDPFSRAKEHRITKRFVKELRKEAKHIKTHDVAALVMLLPFEISVNANVDNMIEEFGDEILDSIIGPAGMNDKPEHVWLPEIESFHQHTLDLLAEVADDNCPKHSAPFVTTSIKAIAEDQLNVSQAFSQAYQTFREAVSPKGSIAFRQAISDGKTPSQAMRAFYDKASESGEYISRDKVHLASKSKLTILTASSGYTETREINWRLAKYKADKGELFVSGDSPEASKKALYQLLKGKNWSGELNSSLAE